MYRSVLRATALLIALVVTGAVFWGTPEAYAQSMSDEDDPPRVEGRYVTVGVNVTNLGPLNDRFSAAGYPTFSTEMLSVGIGGYRAVGPILLGAELQGLFTPPQGAMGREGFVGGGTGLLTLGYLIEPSASFRLYPQVGVGGGGLLLQIGSAGADQFDDVLADPGRSAMLTKGSVLVRLGAGVEYRFGAPNQRGLRLGLQGGYLVSALDSGWRLDPDALSGGPGATLQGPFLRVTIGGLRAALHEEEK
jgi:hypothetical protein